jgi:S1-C subfamily serine protease
VDGKGLVVGMHWGSPASSSSSAIPRSGAIPITKMEGLVARILDSSRVLRPMVGVLIMEELLAVEPPGVPVLEVLAGSPAAAAGMLVGHRGPEAVSVHAAMALASAFHA